MAVTLPQVKRFESSTTPLESGRMDINLPNAEAITAPLRQAGEAVVKTGVEFINKEVDASVNEFANRSVLSIKDEFNRGFETGYSPEDKGLKYKTGPEAFDKGRNDLIQRVQTQYDKIMSDETVSQFVKDRAKSKLDLAMSEINTKLTTWEGKAKDDYQTQLNEAVIQDSVKELITVAGPNFDPARPETQALINQQLFKIEDLIVAEAEAKGHVLVDENGNKQLSKVYEIKLGKTLSTALQNMVENIAYTPGQAEKAKALYDTYSEMIDGFGREQTKKKIEQLSLEDKATELASIYLSAGMSYDQVTDQLNKSKASNEERKEVLKEFTRQTRERQSAIDNRAKEIYNIVHEDVFSKIGTPNAYKSWEDARSANKAAWDSMNPRQREALKKLIEAPKESDIEVLNKVFEKYENGTLFDMSISEMNEEMTGLNQTHRNMFLRSRRDAENPDKIASKAERRRRVYVKDLLTNELIKQRLLPKNGAQTAEQRELRDKYASNLMAELMDLDYEDIPEPGPGKAADLIKRSVERTKGGIDYIPQPKAKATPQARAGAPVQVQGTAKGAYSIYKNPTPRQRRVREQLAREGKLTKGGPDDTFERIDIYIREGK